MSFSSSRTHPDSSGGADLRIGIAAASYNAEAVDQLLHLVLRELERREVPSGGIAVERVPGSMEIPFALEALARSAGYDALIGLGVVIAGDTAHHDVIGYTTARSLQQLSLDRSIPIINGILVVNNDEQARERLGDKADRGAEFAGAAVEMARLSKRLRPEGEFSADSGHPAQS